VTPIRGFVLPGKAHNTRVNDKEVHVKKALYRLAVIVGIADGDRVSQRYVYY
jgi:hypothetical protein